MPHELTYNSYGKGRVRVTKVVRHGDRHELFELAVKVTLRGDFDASYTAGDNTNIVATDSIKNTVYVLAKETDFTHMEPFAVTLAKHFVDTYPQVSTAEVDVEQPNWVRVFMDGESHDHAFTRGSGDLRTSRAVYDGTTLRHVGGLRGLEVLKTTASEFHGFVDDRYRTLRDTTDRIFATTIDATWTYLESEVDFAALHAGVKRIVLDTFATHHSLAVQQTLLAIGNAVLDAVPHVDEIRLQMPNQHRIPMNLEPFGLTNENEIFVATDEPFGMITGTVKRG
ncbi:MAG: factor-independent urate hydroxylase [Planctomycetota bacterium]